MLLRFRFFLLILLQNIENSAENTGSGNHIFPRKQINSHVKNENTVAIRKELWYNVPDDKETEFRRIRGQYV